MQKESRLYNLYAQMVLTILGGRKSRITKDNVEEAELQIMVDGEPINFSELDIPQPE